jgi:Na+-driven multidrug efflux pump
MNDHESFLGLFRSVRRFILGLLFGSSWLLLFAMLASLLPEWIGHRHDPTDGGAWFYVLMFGFFTGGATFAFEDWIDGKSRFAALRLVPAILLLALVALLALFVPHRAPRGEPLALDLESVAAVGYLALVVRSLRRARARVALPHATVKRR